MNKITFKNDSKLSITHLFTPLHTFLAMQIDANFHLYVKQMEIGYKCGLISGEFPKIDTDTLLRLKVPYVILFKLIQINASYHIVKNDMKYILNSRPLFTIITEFHSISGLFKFDILNKKTSRMRQQNKNKHM